MSPFDLNLRHLRALATLVSTGSITAAADAMGMTQPSLTQALAGMERRVGARLFDRQPSGVLPTAEGRTLAERAGFALEHLEAAARTALGPTRRGFARADLLMTATQLRALLALSDAGGLPGAAARTGLSQPALHRAIRDLERACAAPLVQRSGRRLQMTRAGRLVARGARLACAELAAGLGEIRGDDPGRVVVGAMPLARAQALPAAIAEFVRRKPGVPIKVVEGSWRELVEPLLDGVIDLMVGAMRDEPPVGVDQRLLFEDRLVVIARPGHPLSGRRVGAEELTHYDWIAAAPGAPLRERWEELLTAGSGVGPVIECGSTMVIRGVLAGSDLLALASPDQIAIELASGVLAVIDVDVPSGARRIGIATRTGWRPTIAQATFVAMLAEASRISGKAMEGQFF